MSEKKRAAKKIVPILHRLPAVTGEPLPQWDASHLRARRCFSCGADDSAIICNRPDGLAVVRCRGCSAMYLPLIPSTKDLLKFYSTYSTTKLYLKQQEPGGDLSWNQKIAMKVASVARVLGIYPFLRVLAHLRPPLSISSMVELLIRSGGVRGKSALEIGPSSHGGMLPELRNLGARVAAVEIDSYAEESLTRMSIPSYRDISLVPGTTEIVIAMMVLEHLEDPQQFLISIATKMDPGGRILVTVPNAGQSIEMGDTWVGFRLDLEHLNYFTSGSLCRLLDKAGLYPECIWKSGQPMLSSSLPFADRLAVKQEVESLLGRSVQMADHDPFGSQGEFTLGILARRVSTLNH
jgi:hypothetical protein